MTVARRLIVNADDFGLSAGIDRGVADAHEHGVVTSASLMVGWPSAPSAVASAKRWEGFSIGLHVDLGEWAYRDGVWRPTYARVPFGDADAIAAEIDAQLNAFVDLVGRQPTHLDSHQHVHRKEPVRHLMLERAERLGIPARELVGGVRYCGTFYGLHSDGSPNPEAISYDGFLDAVRTLPDKMIEVCCHPAAEVDFESTYSVERLYELRTLCDPCLGAALSESGFTLASFHDLGGETGPV